MTTSTPSHPSIEMRSPVDLVPYSNNAIVETFFKTLKAELIWRTSWQTRDQVTAALLQDINGFYNSRRRHSAIGGMAPARFEQQTR